MKQTILTICITFCIGLAYGQYEGILIPTDTIETYPTSFSRYGDSITIDGKLGTIKAYDSLMAHFEEIRNCCPCLIRTRSKADSVIISEQVKCDRKWVGEFKSFDSLGNIKVRGFYEYPDKSKIQDTLSYGMGDPGNMTGEWVYFNNVGDTTRTEIWKNGHFISSNNGDTFCSIWGYSATIDSVGLNRSTISIDSLSKVQIKYLYKSKNQDCKPKISLTLFHGNKSSNWIIESDSFNSTDFRKLFAARGEIEYGNCWVWLSLLTNEEAPYQIPQTVFKLTD
ncbi:MAG: hypothetical protein N4A41_08930 [Crocinitomicaceae bacterium]|jgi:hypothetical protein|nr:hypothetical protein [Crocinitomicaceae bacterium]